MCYKEKIELLDRVMARGHRSASFPLLSACRFVEFDTSIICHVLVYCFFSFLLQDIFLSLQEFAFEGQNITFAVNVLFTCTVQSNLDYPDLDYPDFSIIRTFSLVPFSS